MTDIVLTLGGFVFRDLEVPEDIPLPGGEQRLNIHQLVGDSRDIQAMGATPAPISWAGRFRGAEAVSRSDQVDAIRSAGKAVSLTWGDRAFTVIVREFLPRMLNPFEVPYTITCEVVTVGRNAADQPPSAHQMVVGDNASMQALGAGFEDPDLDATLATLGSAVAAVPNFAVADLSTLALVQEPLRAVSLQVGAMIVAREEIILATAGIGGVVAGVRPSDMAASLLAQTDAMGEVAGLYNLHDLAGRMATNLAAIGSGGSVLTVVGANLLELAATYYGDASAWPTIAKANGLTDPVVTGVRQLLIPPVATDTGGVLKEIIGSPAPEVAVIDTSQGGSGSNLDFSDPDNAIWLSIV